MKLDRFLLQLFAGDRVSIAYLAHKSIISVYIVICLILDIKCSIDGGWFDFYWIYLTKWGFCLLVFSYVYEMILVCIRFFLEKTEKSDREGIYFFEKNHCSTMISWALTSIANSTAIAITVVYWQVLHDPNNQNNTLEMISTINIHLMQVRCLSNKLPFKSCYGEKVTV